MVTTPTRAALLGFTAALLAGPALAGILPKQPLPHPLTAGPEGGVAEADSQAVEGLGCTATLPKNTTRIWIDGDNICHEETTLVLAGPEGDPGLPYGLIKYWWASDATRVVTESFRQSWDQEYVKTCSDGALAVDVWAQTASGCVALDGALVEESDELYLMGRFNIYRGLAALGLGWKQKYQIFALR